MSLAMLRDRFLMAFPFVLSVTSCYQWRASFGVVNIRFRNRSPTEADSSVRQCTQQDADARITIASVFRATSLPRVCGGAASAMWSGLRLCEKNNGLSYGFNTLCCAEYVHLRSPFTGTGRPTQARSLSKKLNSPFPTNGYNQRLLRVGSKARSSRVFARLPRCTRKDCQREPTKSLLRGRRCGLAQGTH